MKECILIYIVTAIVSFSVGMAVNRVFTIPTASLQSRAAKTEYAGYNQTTGEFYYINDQLKYIIEGKND